MEKSLINILVCICWQSLCIAATTTTGPGRLVVAFLGGVSGRRMVPKQAGRMKTKWGVNKTGKGATNGVQTKHIHQAFACIGIALERDAKEMEIKWAAGLPGPVTTRRNRWAAA